MFQINLSTHHAPVHAQMSLRVCMISLPHVLSPARPRWILQRTDFHCTRKQGQLRASQSRRHVQPTYRIISEYCKACVLHIYCMDSIHLHDLIEAMVPTFLHPLTASIRYMHSVSRKCSHCDAEDACFNVARARERERGQRQRELTLATHVSVTSQSARGVQVKRNLLNSKLYNFNTSTVVTKCYTNWPAGSIFAVPNFDLA